MDQKVLRLDISMAEAFWVNICNSSETLICINFHKQNGNRLLLFIIVLQNSKNSFWNIVHHDIQVYLIWLITLGVKGMSKINNIRVRETFHDLELSVFIPFILIDLLDGDFLSCFVNGGLKDNPEGSVAHHSLCIVSETLSVVLFTNFHWAIDNFELKI